MAAIASVQRWLFRLTPDRQSPIVLGQRRIFILPTRAGLLFATVLAVMLIGAINYNLSLGHALIFLLAGLAVVAMVHTFNNLFGLRLTPGRAAAVFSGDLAHFPLQLENTRRQSRRALDFAFAGQPVASFDLPAEGQATIAIAYATRRRGRLEPGRVTLSTRYPLGLFRAWSYPHPPWSCIVYPKPIRTPLPPASAAVHADHLQGDNGQEDFAGLRPRQISDPTRHIAWKAVARRPDEQPHLVKQFAGGAAEELWFDWSLTPPGRSEEERLSILAGWILGGDEQQARYGLSLPGRRIAPGQGDAHRANCLQALALHGESGESGG
ncbi:MAG: DUF58 domain-containing protein [Candidatus Accumulibacter sp.]|uniref:DUF58 domain-containing protein n=1 Tax=Accumulibacter sp. TaxID=2053492 RepID=UPI0019E2A195|nr:DUF58 domain-containing protein [Accumulibacter sp.]MBE2259119.1 DUF58 domain-containing protein [Paracoccaceae bacterium]MCB1940821.1 DUF58 domain-containing protein [Accumulibacter sp.]MCP5247591.1 DUF58 domain-containing protein [Accumulibacter sp.]